MKRALLRLMRSTGLLKFADSVMLFNKQIMAYPRNRKFVREHPDFAYPPADLAFDAYNSVDKTMYLETGLRQARVYAKIIRDNLPSGPVSILEWGCGPARIIRHMRDCLGDDPVTLTGSDYNQRSIAWSRAHIPGVEFATNDFMPPLPFPSETFDVVYNFSVFTHLSENAQKEWARELWRVLVPGGILICSTHGDEYCRRLASDSEAEQYRRGEVVVQSRYTEGKKWFLSLHPPRYVKEELLSEFADVQPAAVEIRDHMHNHDVWVARKALRQATVA